MNYKCGKKPARPDAVKMRFGAYFKASNLPPPPVRMDPPRIGSWGMLANDRYADCVFAGFAHETMALESTTKAPVATFTSSNVLSDYGAVTGFSPNIPDSDQGTDLTAAAKYRQQTGIIDLAGNRHKIDVYAAIERGNLDQIALAVQILGIAGIGVLLPKNAEEQLELAEPWHMVPGYPPDPNYGHYVPCVGRNSLGNFLFVSWGRLQAATPLWVSTCMDEGVAYLSRERLAASGLSPDGLDLAKLQDDFTQLTGSP